MPELATATLQWVADALGDGGSVTVLRGLRDGGSPWLLHVTRGIDEFELVLRVGDTVAAMRTEQAGLELAAAAGVPVPGVIAIHVDHRPPLLLTEVVTGSSAIPVVCPVGRLRRLGAVAAELHRVPVPAGAGVSDRDRPIAGVDFDALRAQQPTQPLLARAEEYLRQHRPQSTLGLTHGDLWQGNAMWQGDALTGLIDWDCAGRGPAGVDLGSLRCDAAVCFGLPAADEVLLGWEESAGRPADDVDHWDVVAALSTPPDMGWFAGAMAGQGRPDLDRELLARRRDEFLARALARLGG